MRRVKHPNIIMLIEEVDTPTELYLVMELVKVTLSHTNTFYYVVQTFLCTWCMYEFDMSDMHSRSSTTFHVCSFQGGDLFDAITSSTKYTETDASVMVFNLAGALKYLHRMSIVHRDIKPENLLVSHL